MSAAMPSLHLYQVPGEARGEIVFSQTWERFTIWLKHEYTGAPWEWIIVEGRVPIAMGEAPDQATGEARLTEAVAEFCPGFQVDANERPGLISRLWRAL